MVRQTDDRRGFRVHVLMQGGTKLCSGSTDQFRHLEFSIVPVGGAVTYFTRHRCNFVNLLKKSENQCSFAV